MRVVIRKRAASPMRTIVLLFERKRQSNTPSLCFGSDASERTADGSKAFVGCAMASESGWSAKLLYHLRLGFLILPYCLTSGLILFQSSAGGVGLVRLNLSL